MLVPIPSTTYDPLNRLTGVSSLRGGAAPEAISLATHTYDGEGKRISATEGGVTTTYLYDGLLPVLERQGSSTTVNVWGLSLGGGIGGLLARVTPRGTHPFPARCMSMSSTGAEDGAAGGGFSFTGQGTDGLTPQGSSKN